MTKTGKGKVTKDEKAAKELMAQVERQKKEREVAAGVQKVLEDAGYALQPFLSYSEYGIIPRVRLVVNEQANEQTENTGDSKEAGDKDGATGTESA